MATTRPAVKAEDLTRLDGAFAARCTCPRCGRAAVAPLIRLDVVPCACSCGATFDTDVSAIVPTEVP